MEILIDIVLPVFGLMLVGYLATKAKLFSAESARGLSLFVFNFAIPVLLFQSVSQARLPDPFEWDFVLSYYLGCAGAWALFCRHCGSWRVGDIGRRDASDPGEGGS